VQLVKGGKKNRKHNRNRRRPGKARYTSERRWVANRSRRVRRCNGERYWTAWCAALTEADGELAQGAVANVRSRRSPDRERRLAA
jgi:hypothetical protein